jgi:hypothetical protein
MGETFYFNPRLDSLDVSTQADLRLTRVHNQVGQVAEGNPPQMERVERFGELLASVEIARRMGAPSAKVAAARSAVMGALRAYVPAAGWG